MARKTKKNNDSSIKIIYMTDTYATCSIVNNVTRN